VRWGGRIAFALRSEWVIREFPESPLQGSRNTGSFDCVVVRFADGYVAQDDKYKRRFNIEAAEGAAGAWRKG